MPKSINPQKRRYVRLNVVLPVKFREYTGNPNFLGNFNIGRTSDLSSGGIGLIVSKPILPGTKLDLEIEMDESKGLYIVGEVLNGREEIIDGIPRRTEKINFIELERETQDIIMKYIFDHQRNEVRKMKKDGGGK